MQTASVGRLKEVFGTLEEALAELDLHGEAMAALHLAMAVDCLRDSMDGSGDPQSPVVVAQPYLRLVSSS